MKRYIVSIMVMKKGLDTVLLNAGLVYGSAKLGIRNGRVPQRVLSGALAGAMLLSSAGCFGGGGGSKTTEPVAVDPAPVIENYGSFNGGVEANAKVFIMESPTNSTTVTAPTVSDKDANGNDTTASLSFELHYSPDGNTFNLVEGANVQNGETVEITDVFGNNEGLYKITAIDISNQKAESGTYTYEAPNVAPSIVVNETLPIRGLEGAIRTVTGTVSDLDGSVASLMLGTNPITIDADGNFSYDITLSTYAGGLGDDGASGYTLRATDNDGATTDYTIETISLMTRETAHTKGEAILSARTDLGGYGVDITFNDKPVDFVLFNSENTEAFMAVYGVQPNPDYEFEYSLIDYSTPSELEDSFEMILPKNG